MQRLTITHVRRWQEHKGYAGLGHVYQGRYKSFPVESDEHFWVVARSVERNALDANLVLRAEKWRWSSLWQRCHPPGAERSLLAAWPIDMPANWLERVNRTDDGQELEAFAGACKEAAPLASRNGRRKSRNVWAYYTKSGKIHALLFHGLCRLGKIDWASESHQELDRCLSRTITASKTAND